jgi:hypothetical protein
LPLSVKRLTRSDLYPLIDKIADHLWLESCYDASGREEQR